MGIERQTHLSEPSTEAPATPSDQASADPADPNVWQEIEIAADPWEVWETISTEAGRELWLEPDAGRDLEIVESDPPERLVWQWTPDAEPARRVEFLVVAIPSGSRVIVIESAPSLDLTMLASVCQAATALAL